MITPHNHALWALRHDWRDLGELVFLCSLIANFLPSERRVCGWLYRSLAWMPAYRCATTVHAMMLAYNFVIAMIAFGAINWRAKPISLDALKFDEHKQ